MTAETKTVSVEITDWADFREGDFVQQLPGEGPNPDQFVVVREVPAGPDYRAQFVAAKLDGAEVFGFVDNAGDFSGMEDGFHRFARAGSQLLTDIKPLAVFDTTTIYKTVDDAVREARRDGGAESAAQQRSHITQTVLTALNLEETFK